MTWPCGGGGPGQVSGARMCQCCGVVDNAIHTEEVPWREEGACRISVYASLPLAYL